MLPKSQQIDTYQASFCWLPNNRSSSSSVSESRNTLHETLALDLHQFRFALIVRKSPHEVHPRIWCNKENQRQTLMKCEMSFNSYLVEHSGAQQIEFRAPVHHPFDQLQTIDLTFDLPLTPLGSE